MVTLALLCLDFLAAEGALLVTDGLGLARGGVRRADPRPRNPIVAHFLDELLAIRCSVASGAKKRCFAACVAGRLDAGVSSCVLYGRGVSYRRGVSTLASNWSEVITSGDREGSCLTGAR